MSKEIFIKSLKKIGTKLSDFEEVPNEKRKSKYTILGIGNFGYAEKMKSKKNNLYYAIKKLDKFKIQSIKNFHRETEIMFNLDHENIIKFYGYFEDIENITKYRDIYRNRKNFNNEKEDRIIYCLVLEYAPRGSLNDFLIKNRQYLKTIRISETFIIQIFKQLLKVLVYLFQKSVLHRDIKPDNILFDRNNNVKVGDFGLAVLYEDKNPEHINKDKRLFGEFTCVGPLDFISPEVRRGVQYDYQCDIFSVGLTMLCLISKGNPIKMSIDENTKEYIRNIDTSLINSTYNKLLIDLVLLMINDDPLMRPKAEKAYDNLIQIEKMKNGKNLPIEKLKNHDVNYNNNNTSLIRVIQLFCRCIKENIKSKIQGYITDSLSLDLFNIMEITTQKIANQIDKKRFNQSIINFRKKISSKSVILKEDKEISPKLILDELFRITKEDFKINNIIWKSNILNGIVESNALPRISFPHIYEKIELIKKEYKNPFFDYFYYISIELTNCPNCNITFQPKAHCFYFIPLPAKIKGKISNLIINYFNIPKKVEVKCDKCSNNKMVKYRFFTTPKYLLIFLDGNEKKEKILDEYIDLSPFCYTNKGPKKYYLYGFIKHSSTSGEYKSIIKNEKEKNWIFFSGIDDIAKTGFNYNLYYLPNLAVYKGLD